VLSLDGGGIRGLITANVVEYMERYSYNYTREKYCIPERPIERMSMAELFDMVSGTSTGSLLATSIVLPNTDKNSTQINKFFSTDAIRIYAELGSKVFQKFEVGYRGLILGTTIFAILGALLGLWIGASRYHDKEHEDSIKAFKSFIEIRR